MTNTSDTDLDYLKSVAESGTNAALIGGQFLIYWGSLTVIATLAHWAILSGTLPVEPQYVGAVWLVYGVVGVIGQAVLKQTMTNKSGAGSIGNRVNRAAWRYVGIGVAVYVAGIIFSVTALDAPSLLFDSILSIAFFGYAFAFAVTAAVSQEKWLYGPSWISIAAAGLLPAFYGRAELYLIAAAVILFAAVLPGLRMMAKEGQQSDG